MSFKSSKNGWKSNSFSQPLVLAFFILFRVCYSDEPYSPDSPPQKPSFYHHSGSIKAPPLEECVYPYLKVGCPIYGENTWETVGWIQKIGSDYYVISTVHLVQCSGDNRIYMNLRSPRHFIGVMLHNAEYHLGADFTKFKITDRDVVSFVSSHSHPSFFNVHLNYSSVCYVESSPTYLPSVFKVGAQSGMTRGQVFYSGHGYVLNLCSGGTFYDRNGLQAMYPGGVFSGSGDSGAFVFVDSGFPSSVLRVYSMISASDNRTNLTALISAKKMIAKLGLPIVSCTATERPTQAPSKLPTKSPTQSPTASPTTAPTASPTPSPTASPTASPTESPTPSPTESPTKSPTKSPTTPSLQSTVAKFYVELLILLSVLVAVLVTGCCCVMFFHCSLRRHESRQVAPRRPAEMQPLVRHTWIGHQNLVQRRTGEVPPEEMV